MAAYGLARLCVGDDQAQDSGVVRLYADRVSIHRPERSRLERGGSNVVDYGSTVREAENVSEHWPNLFDVMRYVDDRGRRRIVRCGFEALK